MLLTKLTFDHDLVQNAAGIYTHARSTSAYIFTRITPQKNDNNEKPNSSQQRHIGYGNDGISILLNIMQFNEQMYIKSIMRCVVMRCVSSMMLLLLSSH